MKTLSRRRKRVALGFLGIGFLVVIVVMASARFMAVQKERQRFDAERGELRAPDPVAHVVGAAELERTRLFSAELLPWVEANVPAEAAGRVVETLVEAGQEVGEGGVMVKLDDRRAAIALDLAKARHEEAMRLLGEAERLQKSRVVSQTAYEAALSEAKVTLAQLNDARDLIERHVVRAPFAGVVGERLVDVGDAVNLNEPVATVVRLDKLRVQIEVAGADLDAFPEGRTLKLRLLSDGSLHSPVVRFRSPSADPETRLFRVEAELDNSAKRLAGGLQGVVEARVRLFPKGPVVPAAAVRFSGRDAVVLKVPAPGEDPVPLKIVAGPEVDGVFPVFEGLEVGDRILIR
jgi:membrane fusion protein, multidrug efflux system